VDHGLRTGSAAEARRVKAWLAARGVAHRTLRWPGPKPRSGVQAAARAARAELLGAWCRRHGILHLLLAHHVGDQAETFVLRLAAGSGADGLACMASVTETPSVRVLRPLLGVSSARLRATLRASDQDWIEDPSNRDPAFARVRVRAALAAAGGGGSQTARVAASARKLGLARVALERDTARLLAGAASIHPSGYCRLDGAAVTRAPTDVGLRALARALACIGGAPYPGRRARLARLYEALASGALTRPRTLGGCIVAPRRDGLLIIREPGTVADTVVLTPGVEVRWDGRYRAVLARAPRAAGYTLGALGAAGLARLVATAPEIRDVSLPTAARPALPAVFDRRGIIAAVPHLGYRRGPSVPALQLWFMPSYPLGGVEFSVV
jgi:tRNA(Ile)-lysidine synthase